MHITTHSRDYVYVVLPELAKGQLPTYITYYTKIVINKV